MPSRSDAQLLDDLRSRRLDALEELWGRHSDGLRRYRQRLCLPVAEGGAVWLGDCFLHLYKYQHGLDKSLSLETQLFRFAHEVGLRGAAEELDEDLFDAPFFGVSESLSPMDLQQRVRSLLLALPVRQRDVFVLNAYEGQGVTDIGDILRLDTESVDGLLKASRRFVVRHAPDVGLRVLEEAWPCLD